MDFQKIQDLVFETYKKDGYFDIWEKIEKILEPHGFAGIAQLAEVGLFHTEVAESQEEVRNMDKMKLRKELADRKIEPDSVEEMIDNVRKYGNPFGKIEEGKIFDRLYCC